MMLPDLDASHIARLSAADEPGSRLQGQELRSAFGFVERLRTVSPSMFSKTLSSDTR